MKVLLVLCYLKKDALGKLDTCVNICPYLVDLSPCITVSVLMDDPFPFIDKNGSLIGYEQYFKIANSSLQTIESLGVPFDVNSIMLYDS